MKIGSLKLLALTVMAVSLSVLSFELRSAMAQSRRIPKLGYYSAFREYYQGDYKTARRRFRSEFTSAFQIGTNRYLDSVCILTMLGECHYQVGDYAAAMEFYDQGLNLYLNLVAQRWQQRIKLPQQIRRSTSAVQTAQITWGTPSRRGQIPNLPDTLPVVRGNVILGQALQTGGAVDPAEIRPVDVTEVMRCVALVISRRHQILGPGSVYDPLTLRTETLLKRPGIGDGTYLGSLNGIVYGLVLSSTGKTTQAIQLIQRSLQISGSFDHPLTALGLIELSRLALEADRAPDALRLASEASYTAGYFRQYDRITEALSAATQAHLLTQRSLYPPLRNAVAWADREDAEMMRTALTVRMAECFSEAGDPQSSNELLDAANRLMSRRNSLSNTLIASRSRYLTALNQFLLGNSASGLGLLQNAIEHLGTRSKSQYRLRTADALNAQGKLTARQADALYTLTLQDPTELQWKLEPMEAIAFLMTPHVDAMQRWFTVMVNRKRDVKSLQIADAIKRHRFYSTLPIGGRLLTLRWVMHGDSSLLSQDALKQRSSFLTRYPGYRRLVNEAASVRAELDTVALFPIKGDADFTRRTELVSKLVEISAAQEAQLASFALRREPAELAFPPRVSPERIQSSMQADQLAIYTLQTGEGYHIYAIDSRRIRYLGLVGEQAVSRRLAKIFKSMGVTGNYASTDLLTTDDWKVELRNFQSNLLEDIDPFQLASTRELIVVPDGLLWYLPWEAFSIDQVNPDQDDEAPPIEGPTFAQSMKIRYCPTLSLAFARPQAVKRDGKTGLVASQLFPKTDPAATRQYVDQYIQNEPNHLAVPDQVIFPSNHWVFQLDQLVTLHADQTRGASFKLKPLAVDTARFGTTLFEWLELPLWAPDTVVMPGLNSIGAGASRSNGGDLFLTSTALLASGSRAALLARWNTGGQTQMQIAGEFAKHSRAMTTTEAHQRTIAETKQWDVDYSKEPRIDVEKDAQPIKADHPFFWANQMLVALPEPAFAPQVVQNTPPLPTILDDGNDPLPAPETADATDVKLAASDVKPADESEEDDEDGAVWSIGGKKKK